jgi:hypothetical protein
LPTPLKLNGSSIALRTLALAIGLFGLGWGIWNLRSGEAGGVFGDAEAHLLRFETYGQTAATSMLASAFAQELSPCDNHSQRALLLLELPLAEAALRSGSVQDFDNHIRALEARTRRILSCVPRDSLVWLVAFALAIEHGTLNEHTFNLLAMSYDTAPNEAWMGVRRISVAIPVVLSAPQPIQQRILTEFQNLIKHRFVELPVQAYSKASGPTRALLQSRIEQLDPIAQKTFSEALAKLGS